MTHGRKYGDKPSRPFSVWNGILEHRRQIGAKRLTGLKPRHVTPRIPPDVAEGVYPRLQLSGGAL